MKYDELKKKAPDDLKKEMDSAVFDLLRLNAMVATGGIGKDSGKIRELKRKVARIKTLQRTPPSAKSKTKK